MVEALILLTVDDHNNDNNDCNNDDGGDDGDDVMLSPSGSAPILPIIVSHNYWHCNCVATIGITQMYFMLWVCI